MFDSLSKPQKEIVFNKSGCFVVRACPGSGKTFCVAARLSHLMEFWGERNAGIATLSFTNVAHQEIQKNLSKFSLKSRLGYPHFLGTIDSFINQYIFLPYGHLILECDKRPMLVGEPHGAWRHQQFFPSTFDKFAYDIDGDVYLIWRQALRSNWSEDSRYIATKKRLNRAGYVTQLDANYFALKVLEKYPKIATAIVKRFPFLIVDEAQDTSEIQMKIIDTLIKHGLREVMLVGDPDQAIYEFNKANPKLLEAKFSSWSNSCVLNENRRSSRLICEFTHKLSGLPEISTAVNAEVSSLTIKPAIFSYEGKMDEIIPSFLDRCLSEGIDINHENVAILFRSKSMLNELLGRTFVRNSPWKDDDFYVKDLVLGKFLYSNGRLKEGFKLVQRVLVKITLNQRFCTEKDLQNEINKVGHRTINSNTKTLIDLLPAIGNKKIGNWVDEANNVLSLSDFSSLSLSIKRTGKDYSFGELFPGEESGETMFDCRIGTVHSAKGETFEAVLMVLKSKADKAYKTYLQNNTPISESEELRIVYVGLTRPRRLVCLAVPNKENEVLWKKKFEIA